MLVLFWKGVWRYLICVELTTRVLCFLCIDISTTENSGEQKQKKSTMQNKILYACIVIVAFLLNSIGIKAIGQNTINVCYNGDTIINLSSTHQAWVYRWEKKTTSSSFWTFTGTGVQLVISSVTQSIDVRCMADTNNDGLSDSLVRQLTISPYPELVPASISGNGTICYDSPSPIQSVLIPASGGGDIYSYQWQFSDNNGSSWYNINGATQNTYIDHNLISNRSYRLLTTSLAGCGRAYSNTTFVSVYGNLIAPTISTTTPAICYDSIPDMITMASVAQGGIGSFSYQWQLFDGEGFSDIVGETSTSFQPPALRHTMTYRLSATNECGTVYSSSITISVYPQLIAGVIDSEKNICFNSPASLSFTSNPSGGAGLYTYQWQTSNDGVFWTDIPNAIQNVYVTPQMVDSAFYRVIVGALLCCVTDTTNVCKVNVFNPLVPGVIYGDSVICHSTAPNTLLMLADAAGGSGEYSYQWQKSTNGVVWSNIVGATLHSYQPSNLSVTTNYRVVQTSSMGCGSVYSNVVTITVLPSITSPVIALTTTSTICYDSVPADVRITEASIGADGIFSYQWQERAGGIWSDIPSATQSFFQPSALREDCSYRVVSTSDYGCGSRISNEVTISVYPRINAGTLNDQLICHNTTATMDFATFPTGGGNSFTYRWQHSVDGETWSDISMAVAPSYTTPVLLDTTQYRVVVASAMGCSSDTTEAAHINVLPQFVAGTIGHDTTVCYNTSPGIVSMQSDAVGGMAPYTYQWQFSISGMPFSDVNGQMQTYYQVPTQTESMQYRLKFTSQNGCEPVYSAPINVNVWEEITAPTISTTTTTAICYDSVPANVYIDTYPTGADGDFSYQWQSSEVLGEFVNIEGETGVSYQPDALRSDFRYRVLATSTYGCGTLISDTVIINVFPRINAGLIGNDSVICHNDSVAVQFNTMPNGGGGMYTYQWQFKNSEFDWQSFDCEGTTNYTTPVLDDTTYYRVVVISDLHCSQDTTNVVQISVLPRFVAGVLSSTVDSVCYGDKPAFNLSMIADANGGMSPYRYQWLVGTDTNNMSEAPNETTPTYQPDTIFATTYYQLVFTSSHNCGVMASNIHTIKMNPLPYSHLINGNDTVCYAQYETYFLPESSTDFSYLWSLEGGNGDVTALSPNNDSVEIYWRNAQTMDRIVVEVTDNVTGCKSTNYKQVQTSTQSAPDRTVVIRKPNSNILVCEQESPSMYYQWGYTIKATGEDVVIENSNRRYVLLPHDFDSTKYDYWVVLAPNATSPCYSTSYYDPANDSLIVVPEAPKLMVYNVDRQRLNITVSNVGDKATRIGVYNMMGCAVYEITLPSSSHGVTVELPERGVFVVQATPQGVEPMTEKVVVE